VKTANDEKPVDLFLWPYNGHVLDARAGPKKLDVVSIGRTGSKWALGFRHDNGTEFVLNRAQVEVLRDFLTYQAPRLWKGRRRKPSLASYMCSRLAKRAKKRRGA
jgi:hypothetical protein